MSISRNFRAELQPAIRGSFLREPRSDMPLQGITSRSHEATLDWFAAAERVGRYIDLDTSAHAHGAMLRRRGVPSATNLLCLAFLYGPGRMPLRLIAERADSLGIAHVSEPALLRRLLNAGDWLEHLVDTLIQHGLDQRDDSVDASGAFPFGRMGAAPMQMLHGMPAARDQRSRQTEMAKKFILDFVPWPEDLYTDSQIHWLLCVRWTFVASTIRDMPAPRADADAQPVSALERTRTLAHLISATLSRDEQQDL